MFYTPRAEGSELDVDLPAECLQRTPNNVLLLSALNADVVHPRQFTSQPDGVQSVNTNQYDTTLIVTELSPTYGGETTTKCLPRYNLSDLGPSSSSPSGLLFSGIAQPNIGSNVAGQIPHDIYSYHPRTASSAHNVDLRHIDVTDLSPVADIEPTIQPFHPDTQHQLQYQEEHCPEHLANNHWAESHVSSHSPFDYNWNNGHGLCHRPADADRVTEHMVACHFEHSRLLDGRLKCRWEGCSKLYRRDTIMRHIREVHLGIPRPKPLVARGAIDRLRRSRKKARRN